MKEKSATLRLRLPVTEAREVLAELRATEGISLAILRGRWTPELADLELEIAGSQRQVKEIIEAAGYPAFAARF